MRSAFVFLTIVALSQSVPLTSTYGGRIINGEDAKEGEIPYQISLQLRPENFHSCGGSILNKNYIISAAHCFQRSPDRYQVVAGTLDLSKPQSVHRVTKIIVHEKYTPWQSHKNDIALAKVSPSFEFSNTISQVSLPENRVEIAPGTVAVTSGWGSLKEGGEAPLKLQRTDVLIGSNDYCNKTNAQFGYVMHDSQICIFNPAVETGPCHGDSGGPLIVNNKLVGLTSWGIQCASAKWPGMFTKVSSFLDWIEAHAV